ncbi:hypothetical protein HQ447_05745 [bacterium]|nr:hypothetical protein [bacterium]
MSLLPQRKKSAEEIAQLRESFGMIAPPPGGGALPQEIPVPVAAAALVEKATPPVAAELPPPPVVEMLDPKPVRSLKRSERVPVLAVEKEEVIKIGPPAEIPSLSPREPMIPAAHGPKLVRSLRKSEQGPVPEIHAPLPDSKLPTQRHSDREIQEIRRQEMLAMQAAAGQLPSLTAHPVLIVPGYLFAVAGAVGFYFYELDLPITAGCVVAAILIATFIFFKKPLSLHHAAFIAVMSLFVAIFGALHYFPQLRHGT